MVFFNYATMQMAAKIVYYGPGLCGKTTNLHVIYGRTAPTSRGEMVSLETETDRTLFFDLLPLDVGVIGGFKTRLQLYTVPGQVFYNTTRKLVLKGVDGMVFVADSQRPMLEPNRESLKNLRENLAEIGLKLEDVPRVFQFNKRDLANILTIDELNEVLNPGRSVEWYESCAATGAGVFETLKAISKLTLKSLRGRMTGDAKRRPTVVVAPATPATAVAAASAAAPAAAAPAPPVEPEPPRASLDDLRAAAASSALPQAVPSRPRPAGDSSTLARLARFSELASSGAAGETPKPARKPKTGAFAVVETLKAPKAEKTEKPEEETPSDISFGESGSPAAEAPAAVEASVKHVRVRSNVDILSELDKLRKLSTQKPTGTTGAFAAVEGKPKSSPGISIDDLLTSGLNHKKDVTRSFEIGLPKDMLQRSRTVTIGFKFSNEAGEVTERSVSMELANLKDIQKLLLSLRINIQGE